MALTQVSTGGVKDDAVTAGKIPANAVGSSEIADDAVGAAQIADDGVAQAAVADEAIDEARLQISNAGTNGQFLQKQSGNTGGLTWADVTIPDADKCIEGNTSVEAVDTGSDGHVKITTEGTERVRVNQDGKLLIGTDTARTAIGATGVPALQVEGLNASDSQISIVRNSDTAAGPYFAMVKTRGTSDGSNTIIQADDTLGTLYFTAADGVDINQQSAFVRCQVDGTPGANDTPGRLTFATTPDGGITPTERLRIGSAGQLGVAGANYGTSGQVLTSQGASSAPQWADASSGALGYDVWCVDGDFPAGNSYYREWNSNQQWGSAQTFTSDGGSGAESGGPGPATMSISRCTTSQNPFFAKVGTGMSMSDGIFSFPNTGEWRVTFAPQAVEKNTSGGGHNLYIWTTSDNGSNWHDAIRTLNRSHDSMWAGVPFNVTALRFNITDTSNQKVKFSMGGGDGRTRVLGYSDRVGSHFMFEQIS